MTTHKIQIMSAYRKSGSNWTGHGKSYWAFEGVRFSESRHPLLDAARWLINEGLAHPDDTIEAWRGETVCLRANIGKAAKLTVRETDKAKPVFARWTPFPDTRGPVNIDEIGQPATMVADNNVEGF